ncbi:hypothetical protein BCR33DRAFT_793032 [Rhizoclosmatium globosum]|uniref:CCZ1/INTU/HSP4 first Longin domain-containing protein n=1 Tax=Rhizoclosmatium globosum TaxID=329046 RepID=A0A1Y2B3Q7_9FUNG|nr:hypothetical protein BCR33DRAFT_793032 [Rhizoclosmatium globosum]|eukprot:ORY29463.1 hypothetical protein BCR33DRAFT_793032 [Rhizoclosmatium globosum]
MSLAIKNFFVVHKSGESTSPKTVYHGNALDPSLVLGFSSSVSNFSHTLLGEEIKEVISSKGRIIYKEYGDFLFVAHSDLQAGSTAIQAILRDVGAMFEFLFGTHEFWDEDFFDLKGAQDIVSMYFGKIAQDPSMVVGGINQIYLDPHIIERLDRLISFLESQDGVCGNGTMLILGDSALYSRFDLPETRKILQYNKARPLGASSVRYTPVFCNNAWHNLYLVRIHSYILAVLTFIDKSYDSIASKIDEFRISFVQSRLEIPIEEPPSFSAFSQNLRPGPEVQQKEILSTFWAFFYSASSTLKMPGVTEFSIARDQYRFYARSEGVHKLYILFSTDAVSAESVPSIASEVLKNVRAYAI